MKSIRDQVCLLCNQSDFDIYMDMLDKDISSHRLSKEIKKEIIEKSILVAEEYYKKLVKEYGMCNITKYVYRLGVPIDYVREKPTKYYSYIGLFKEKTKTITVNLETILQIKHITSQFGLDDIVDINMIKDVVIAHELFHYFELMNPSIYTNQKIIDAKIFGIIKTKSKLLVAGEVAAIHFSKLITNLKHTPLVYNKTFALGKNMLTN